MKVKKDDMRSRVTQAASSAPDIADRLRHAQSLANSHPALPAGEHVAAQPKGAETATNSYEGQFPDANPRHPSTDGKTGTRHVSVPLELIDQNPFNARKIYRSQRVNELSASIGANGQDTPGTATVRDGRYVLAAGHYRLRALKLLNAKTMDLMIRENLTDRDLFAISYRENKEREGQSSLDNALCWKELLDTGLYASETEIADVTGLSLPNVNKTMAALRLSPEMLEVISEDPTGFKMSVLYELVLLEPIAGTPTTIEIAREVLAGKYAREQLQNIRASLSNPKQRKGKETSRQYKLGVGGANIGSLKEWDSGKVTFEIQLVDPVARAALIEELKARFPSATPSSGI